MLYRTIEELKELKITKNGYIESKEKVWASEGVSVAEDVGRQIFPKESAEALQSQMIIFGFDDWSHYRRLYDNRELELLVSIGILTIVL